MVVGRYQLVERLAVGGMAEVFLACERGQHALERLVVVKRILPHLAQDPEFVEMFLHEARVAARIRHPNVVQIYELGEADGFPFIAMEYVPGSTLKQLVRAGMEGQAPLDTAVVVDLISQACAGAHAAHRLKDPSGKSYGLVHRDITPHNLMVSDQGHVKLLDFGIAKASELAETNTRTGMLKGKISYMSPEQCKQETLDRRSDVFALGAVAWELLVGEKCFAGKSELATMQAIVRGRFPDLRERRPDIPEGVVAAIERALAVDLESRWTSAEDFRVGLRDAVRSQGMPVDQDTTRRVVAHLLGDVHIRQQHRVDQALERTMVTISQLQESDFGPQQTDESLQGRSLTTAQTSVAVSALGTLMLLAGGFLTAFTLGFAAFWFWGGDLFTPPRPEGEPLDIVVAPTLDETQVRANFEDIRLYLERELDRPVDLTIGGSYERTAERLVAGEFNYGLLPDGATMETLEDHPRLIPMVTKVMNETEVADGYILSRRDVAVTSLADAKGLTFCYTDKLSNSGWFLPRRALKEAGLDPDKDVTWYPSGHHAQLLLDMLDDKCKLGGTYSLNYSEASQKGVPVTRLRILINTGVLVHDHLLAHPQADPKEVAQITRLLLDFDPMEEVGVPFVGGEKLTGFREGLGKETQ